MNNLVMLLLRKFPCKTHGEIPCSALFDDIDWKIHVNYLTRLHAGAILNDLFKAFDFIDHKLFIAKLSPCDLVTNTLKFIYSCFRGRKWWARNNTSYGAIAEILLVI